MSNISASAYPEKFLNLLEKTDRCKGALPWPFTEYTEDHYDENNTDYNYDSLTICSVKKSIEDSHISKITTQGLMCLSALFEQKCEETLNKTKLKFQENDTFCPGRFDGFMCWPHGRAHSLVEAPCPPGIPYGKDNLSGYRFCEPNGQWYQKGGETWSYWKDCNLYAAESSVPNSTNIGVREDGFQKVCEVLQNVGLTVSLLFLVIALFIFSYFKKLRCIRNYIHICLMLSFILRYVVNIVTLEIGLYNDNNDTLSHNDNDTLSYNDNDTFPENMITLKKNFDQYCDTFGNIRTRVATCPLPIKYVTIMAVLYYAMTANYFWLLIEGVYLQWYINLAKTKDETVEKLIAFVLFGWVGPMLLVGVWFVLVIAVEDPCWTIYSQPEQFALVVQIPIILSIMINFILFINFMRIICSKLRAKTMQKKDKIVRLALSTLALVTLLGTQHTVFFFLSVTLASLGSNIKDVKSLELVCISFQGAFTAILYCFRNSEVQTEVKKFWRTKNLTFAASAFKTCSLTRSCFTRMSTSLTSDSPPRTFLGKISPKSDHCQYLAEGFIKQSNIESKGRNLNFSISTKPLL
ncbi:glucagon-like peptide 1 receptor isoform X2 [Clavelina lepadiformis]|uniref:glucagon-like peptide 1 receptor isoform X2 n=1 Tax=Clavelina lepadiformis TaxID=159417 RepID=UPI0040436683